jgi:hypothetical protein
MSSSVIVPLEALIHRVEPDAMGVDEFCERHRISRTGLYNHWRAGTGPRFFMNGNRRMISREAASDWRRAMETRVVGIAPAALTHEPETT